MICAAASCAVVLVLAGSASAASVSFSVTLDPSGIDSATADGSVYVGGLDDGLSTRLVVSPPSGPDRSNTTQGSGPDFFNLSAVAGLSQGDTVKVFQPSGAGSPVESYVIPAVSINLVVGTSEVTGNVPAGYSGAVATDYRCEWQGRFKSVSAGAFALGGVRVIAGFVASLVVASDAGDSVQLRQRADGETPCVTFYGTSTEELVPGDPNAVPSYLYGVDDVFPAVAMSVRMVVRRGAATLADHSWDPVGFSNADLLGQPFASGDTVEIYRPKTAAAPSWSMTVPQVSATFDADADLLAVDAPAASLVQVRQCRALICDLGEQRSRSDLPAGRTVFAFSKAEDGGLPSPIQPGDRFDVMYRDPDGTLAFHVGATPGDLVAPTQKLSIASKLKVGTLIKAFKKGLKVKLTSSEVGSAKITLALGKAKLATAIASTKVGTTTIRIKFTKSGKKALGKLRKKGRRFKSRKATLTSVITDAAGNVATSSKTVTIKR